MILTKEVSRFSRNILDTISYTRELKSLGIGVLFLTDRINSLNPESEMLLSFLSSMAQEESRRTSMRVAWGQTRQMERGIVFGQSLLGYDVRDGKLFVNQEGAELVRLIFHKYALEQAGTSEIARFLTSEGYRTYRGCTKWKSNTVIKILKNEKYVGDLVQKKTYTPDFLTHEKKSNRGEVPRIVLLNHHEPIVSRDVWNLTQERLRRNDKHTSGERGRTNRYVFSGKIKCGECGSSFVSRCKYLKDGTKVRRWSCGTAVREGTAGCNVGKLIRDDDAIQMLKTAIRSLPMDFEPLIRNVAELALDAVLTGQSATNDDPDLLIRKIEQVQAKKEAMMDAYFSREISRENMVKFSEKYAQQLLCLQKRLEKATNQGTYTQDSTASIRTAIAAILKGETESEVFYKTLLQDITVFKDRHMELRLNLLPQVFHFLG